MNCRWLNLWILLVVFLDSLQGGKKNRIRGVRWWNLAHSVSMKSNLVSTNTPIYINPSLQPLTRKQRRLVTKNPGTIVAVAKGARMAIEECQFQFHARRWNCPTSDDSHGGSIFGKILRKGCRESSFIYALTSAGVTYNIARACAEGNVFTCTCGNKLTITSNKHDTNGVGREWKWGGCSDNAEFGHKFSREFVDVVEKGHDMRYMMNLHNNEAGRLHVSSEMHQECKCHGMSGSCTMKTCWMRLPHFRAVGDNLKDRFDGATRVYQGNSIKRSNPRRFNLLPVNPNHKPPSPKDLVYYEMSPDFCEPNSSISFSGTRDRECNATSIGVDGCDLMCCGRGFKTETYMARERCMCVFHWCCEVTCEICNRTKERSICL